MTQTTVSKFVQAVNENLNLIAELKAAVDIDSYYKIAAAYGYHFTAEELHSELSQQSIDRRIGDENKSWYSTASTYRR